MNKNVEYLKSLNQEFNVHVYDEEKCRQFIEINFDYDVLNAYNKLIPCSYKSDLWRFCVLYKNGGIYVDIKYEFINNFKLIELTDKEYFCKDRVEHCVYTALIIVKPKNEILKYCIQKIVENVKNNYYGNSCLDPTGPGLLGRFFSQNKINNLELEFRDTTFNNIEKNYILYKGDKDNYKNKNIIIGKYYDSYREEQKIYQKNKYYADLWRERTIYLSN